MLMQVLGRLQQRLRHKRISSRISQTLGRAGQWIGGEVSTVLTQQQLGARADQHTADEDRGHVTDALVVERDLVAREDHRDRHDSDGSYVEQVVDVVKERGDAAFCCRALLGEGQFRTRQCGDSDAGYLRAQLQEARWLLKSVEARGETLLKVMRLPGLAPLATITDTYQYCPVDICTPWK